MAGQDFASSQKVAQAAFFARAGIQAGYRDAAWRLADKTNNLAPSIRKTAPDYFAAPDWEPADAISWHIHAAHGLSSQVCCLNFLMPLAERREVLSKVIGRALKIPPPRMQRVEGGPDGKDWFIGFEWTGGPGADFLSEARDGKPLKRGANCTSADAFVQFEGADGPEGLLIEWKYTESYGSRLPDRVRTDGTGGNATRTLRYADKLFDPDGPVRSGLHLSDAPEQPLTLEDFFWEPFYQLVRQQMLAFRIEKATGVRTRVLHLSPAGNVALHRVTSRRIEAITREGDAFRAFEKLLASHDDGQPRFISRTIEEVFVPVLDELPESDPWAGYLRRRYSFLEATA